MGNAWDLSNRWRSRMVSTRTTAARSGWAIPQPQSHRTLKLNSTLYRNIRQYLYWNGTIPSPCRIGLMKRPIAAKGCAHFIHVPNPPDATSNESMNLAPSAQKAGWTVYRRFSGWRDSLIWTPQRCYAILKGLARKHRTYRQGSSVHVAA